MKALCWHGQGDIRCDSVDDPAIEDDRDVIIKVTSCAICGSDLHLMNGYMPTMESSDVLGHETMDEVVEVGKGYSEFKVGDRVVVPFNMACGECYFCQRELFSLCGRSNRNADKAIEMGQTHTHRYLEPLLQKVVEGEIDPTFVITHSASLEDGPELYKSFRDKEDGCIKVVMRP